MKSRIVLLAVLALLIGGAFGVKQYTAYRCSNDEIKNWQFHRVISCEVYFDEKGVVQGDDVDMTGLVKLEGAHIPTFKEIETPYAKDSQSVYYKGRRVARAIPQSFTFSGGEYFTDSKRVFYRGEMVPDSDAQTFSLFEGDDPRYAKDASQEYFKGTVIEIFSEATSSRFLLAPYEGEEITRTSLQDIFWRPVVDGSITNLAGALVGDDGSFQWIFDETISNTGLFQWSPSLASSTPNTEYRLVFYGHTSLGSVKKIVPPNTFRIVEKGKPGVVVKVNFQDERTVIVSPNETVYVSWASSNVEKCYLAEGVAQSLVGHMTTTFPLSNGAKKTKYIYSLECISSEGEVVRDTVSIEAVPQTEI